MSSTDQRLRAFFDAEVAPLAGKVGLRHPLGWTSAGGSCFVDRPEGAVTPMTFTSDASAEDVAARMDAMWAGTPLAGMGAKLMALAAEVEPEAEDGTVSDLIYEMF